MIAAGVVLLAAAVAQGAGGRPALRLVRIDPLTVAGSSFRPAERVTIAAYVAGARRTVQATAGARGGFRVRLGRVPAYDPCAFALFVSARGSRGSSASVRIPPRLCAVRQP